MSATVYRIINRQQSTQPCVFNLYDIGILFGKSWSRYDRLNAIRLDKAESYIGVCLKFVAWNLGMVPLSGVDIEGSPRLDSLNIEK